ncbi:carbon catabolite repressor protein 4 homolog 3-like [Ananas comosus]|uniref:Carbon catabolite repressor protein 4 homolog 3-like n=1 Tax=Ananas comosus TaxID=4615 RepID=A0A6P5FAU0_ANACO|nr:carbon catabolite repressor protein 4 homolog 3-like [Ananas comosus]
MGARRELKRRRSESPGLARAAAANAGDSAAPRDRGWYNPDRRKGRNRPPKPYRRWFEAEGDRSLSSSKGDSFLLISYNILGDNNAFNHRDLYWNIPCDIMKWNSRKGLICREIIHWNADLVCLQEVDRYEDILVHMKRKEYAGCYKGRSGDAKDGCAIFWKEKRFRLLEEESIDFSSIGLRNNVAQLLVFEVDEASKLVVGNIHVLFNPKRGDIKLGQIRMFLLKADALSRKWDSIPILLAGDFNSTPDSAIYKFLSTSELNISEHDRRHLSGMDNCQFGLYAFPSFLKFKWTNDEVRNATGYSKSEQVKHPLKLRSSYATIQGNARTRGPQGEPLATSYHSKFLGTVDYIWYSTGLECRKVLDTLPIDTLRKTGGLPTKEMGSDHLALVAEFVFTEPSELDHPHSTDDSAEEETIISKSV